MHVRSRVRACSDGYVGRAVVVVMDGDLRRGSNKGGAETVIKLHVGESKVRDLDVAFGVKKEILKLEVAMRNLVGMEVP